MSTLTRHTEMGLYWLSHCEGFRVEAPGGRVGIVDHVLTDGAEGDPRALIVYGGFLGTKVFVVPVDQVDLVAPRKERVLLRPSPEIGGVELLPRLFGSVAA